MPKDVGASARAREEGNALFRRGKWTAAGDAYTRAIDADPHDALPWSNRAMVWLKLDRFTDAEADARAALARDASNVKARYRLATALRGLGRSDDAARELREVLRRDPGNSAARAELDELEQARSSATTESQVKTEPAPVTGASTSTSPAVTAPSAPAARAGGFAALRERRTTARPGYVRPDAGVPAAQGTQATSAGPTATPTSVAAANHATTSAAASTAAPPAPPAPPVVAPTATPTAQDVTAAQPAPPPRTAPAPKPPADPASTAPGTGLALLRALRALAPEQRWAYLHYYPAHVVGKILAPVLEPDGVALVLGALDAGVAGGSGGARAASGAGDGQDRMDVDGADDNGQADSSSTIVSSGNNAPDAAGYALTVLSALRRLPRWRMTAAMLSPAERAAGARAWAAAGGQGPWP